MNVEKIILEGQDNLTAEEKDMRMLKVIEKQMGTGPIIGEAREVLLTMSRNILVRDLLLDSLGVTVEKREGIFHTINDMLAERDKKIIADRKKMK